MTRLRCLGRDMVFLDWLRSNPRLDSRREALAITDLDLIVHRYADWREPHPKRRIDNILILETKSHATGPVDLCLAQDDTYAVINALWRSRTRRADGSGAVKNYAVVVKGCKRRVRWWGIHVLALSGDRPENSPLLWWNHRPDAIGLDLLEGILRFEVDPFTLQPIDYRDHHDGEKTRMPLLKLPA